MAKSELTLFLDKIGRQTLAESLGVGVTAVSNAVDRGALPPSWYHVVYYHAGKIGLPVLDEFFAFKKLRR